MTKEGRNIHTSKKYQSKGWIEEIENNREIEILNEKCKAEIKKNKLIMEFSVEYVEAINGNIEQLQKIDKVRKHKRVTLPCELFGSSGVALPLCGKDVHEVSSVRNYPLRGAVARRYIKHKN